MSRLLEALAWVAPRAAVARAGALASIRAVRAYDGATTGRRGASWSAGGSSANSEISRGLAKLRDRSRDMSRNTAAGARILDVFVAHAVGVGITAVPKTGTVRLDKTVSALWKEFVKTADIEGELDLHGQVALATRSMLEGGDVISRFVNLPLGERRFPLAIQVLEGDYIDINRNGSVDGKIARLGVALGDYGVRTGYWIHKNHPGDNTGQLPGTSPFIERSEALHLFRATRPGQVRGVPVFAPILMPARDYADLMDAVVVKARIEACFAGFIESGEADSALTLVRSADAQQRTIDELAPGMMSYLRPGEKVTFANPSSSGQFEPVSLAALMAMAAGAGITYDQLTGDLRQANYSSLRAGKIEFRRLIEQFQWHVLVPKVMDRIWARFIATAILAGKLRERSQGYAVDWVMPANEPIDPKKDLEADILAVRAGRISPQEFIAAWGRDWRDVIDDYAEFLKVIDQKEIILDIDPRKISKLSGLAQPTEEGGAAPPPPAPKPKPKA